MVRFVTRLIIFFVIISVIGVISSYFFYKLLKKDEPLIGKILLVEAWNSAYVIEQAKDLFLNDNYEQIVVVGSKYLFKPYNSNKSKYPGIRSKYSIFKNGYLSINPKWFPHNNESNIPIEIDVKGREVLGINAHFYLVINNTIIGNSFASSEYTKRQFEWNSQGEQIKNFYILFTNDTYVAGSDRNLYVRGIKFNNSLIPLTDSLINLTHFNDRTIMPEFIAFNSLAECTGSYLKELGIPQDKITVLSSEYYSLNKTLSNAKSFASWIEKSSFKNEAVNIFSFDIHSRRTYITFKSEVNKDINLGSIVCNDLTYTDEKWWKSKQRTKLFVSELIEYFGALILSII